jgi:hypothetical protein
MNDLPETRVVPVGMPQDVTFGAYFGGATASFAAPGGFTRMLASPSPRMAFPAAPAPASLSGFTEFFSASAAPKAPDAVDQIMSLVARMEPDGGMPGKDAEDRALASVLVLLALLSQGHSVASGAFRTHVSRLVAFLRQPGKVSATRQAVVDRVIERAQKGEPLEGDWLALAESPGKQSPRWAIFGRKPADRWKAIGAAAR